MNILGLIFQTLLALAYPWLTYYQCRTRLAWRLAVILTSIAVIVVWTMALSGCQPKPKPGTPPAVTPPAVDSTRQQLERNVQTAKKNFQANRPHSDSAVNDYQQAAKDYDASRVQLP